MGDVRSLAEARTERKPHSTGPARCLHCGHEWQAVVPAGVYDGLECSQCGLMRGVLVYLLDVGDNQAVYNCNCGCHLSMLLMLDSGEQVAVCVNCMAHHGTFEPYED